MRCAWKELLEILPQRLRREVDQQGRDGLQELRLRFHAPPELVLQGESRWLQGNITREELSFVVNAASRYSPWAAESMFSFFTVMVATMGAKMPRQSLTVSTASNTASLSSCMSLL